MALWECIVCGLIYDESEGWPDDGIPAGTRWEDVPEDWLCPDCGVGKQDFECIDDTPLPASATTNQDDVAKPTDDTPISQQAIAEPPAASAQGPWQKWECIVCGLIYDEALGWPDDGIPAGTRWADV
ncbi:MAG TPA: rubredoxin reductase, partial [Halieaceae bacterium]|nr:rubredoxin reductase [Halieaceae bacterium]